MSWTAATFVAGAPTAPLAPASRRAAAAVTACRPAGRPAARQRPLLRATLQPDVPDGGDGGAGGSAPLPSTATAAVSSPSAAPAVGGDAPAAADASPPPSQEKKKARKARRRNAPRADGSPRVSLNTLSPGQRLDGVVTNLVKHGAYVDVGATTDGLVHLRDMSVEFVHEAEDILATGDAVEVYVKYAEDVTGRLALSLLRPRPSAASPLPQAARGRMPLADLVVGSRVCGTVRRVSNFGAYVDVGAAMDGFVHVSQLYGRRPRWTLEELRLGQELWVVIDEVDVGRSAIKLRARGRSSYNREQPLTAHGLSDADERAAEVAYMAGFGRPTRGGGGATLWTLARPLHGRGRGGRPTTAETAARRRRGRPPRLRPPRPTRCPGSSRTLGRHRRPWGGVLRRAAARSGALLFFVPRICPCSPCAPQQAGLPPFSPYLCALVIMWAAGYCVCLGSHLPGMGLA